MRERKEYERIVGAMTDYQWKAFCRGNRAYASTGIRQQTVRSASVAQRYYELGYAYAGAEALQKQPKEWWQSVHADMLLWERCQ